VNQNQKWSEESEKLNAEIQKLNLKKEELKKTLWNVLVVAKKDGMEKVVEMIISCEYGKGFEMEMSKDCNAFKKSKPDNGVIREEKDMVNCVSSSQIESTSSSMTSSYNHPNMALFNSTKNQVKYLMKNYPRGILLSAFCNEYTRINGEDLPFIKLSFNNASSLMATLNDIVKMEWLSYVSDYVIYPTIPSSSRSFDQFKTPVVNQQQTQHARPLFSPNNGVNRDPRLHATRTSGPIRPIMTQSMPLQPIFRPPSAVTPNVFDPIQQQRPPISVSSSADNNVMKLKPKYYYCPYTHCPFGAFYPANIEEHLRNKHSKRA